jgi:hypothetical protein
VGGKTLQSVDYLGYADSGATLHEQVDVIGHDFHDVNRQGEFSGFLLQQNLQPAINRIDQNGTAILRTPDDMKLQTENRARVFGVSLAHLDEYTPDSYITQQKRVSANAERLFRCRINATVPEA